MRALDSITLEEAWNGKSPYIVHIHEFGCIAYDEKKGKLDAKDMKCLFLGYCQGTNAYRLI